MVIMLVFLFRVHFVNGFSIMRGGYEYNFVLIMICLSLIIYGQGKLALGDKIKFLKNL